MDTTEARDKAALLRVPDMYRQTERGINYSEWGRSEWRGGGGVIHWSVWLIRHWGTEERKQQLWTGWDCFTERADRWQKSGTHLTSLTFSESSRILDPLLPLLPDLRAWQRGQTTQSESWNRALKAQFTQNTKRYFYASRGQYATLQIS